MQIGVLSRTVRGNSDLWLFDGSRASRLTFDAAFDSFPAWSPDGASIVFQSTRDGSPGTVYQKAANSAGVEEPLLGSDSVLNPTSVSPDGRFLLYLRNDPESGTDLMLLPLAGDRTPSEFLKTPFREAYGRFSPDGRWVAYHSNESGQPEVYVRPFVPPGGLAPGAASQWQISTAGGVFATWAPNGRELYYLDPAGVLMAAPIAVTGATLEAGQPVALFLTRVVNGGGDHRSGWHYDVAPDGRFLINTEQEDDAAPITVLSHWRPPTP